MSYRLLLTGFGRFPSAAANPSGPLAQRLARQRRPALADTHRIAHVFQTSYADVDRHMPRLIETFRPDAILMFGVAMRTSRLRIETQARNRVSLIFPDVRGFVPPSPVIAARAPARIAGPAPFRRLLAAARSSRVKATLSRDAGSYLCNYAYWRAIEASAGLGGRPLVVFIHVPKVPVRPRKRRRRRPAMTMASLVRAGEAIAVAAVSALPRGPGAVSKARSPRH